jgi:hypothetical protein
MANSLERLENQLQGWIELNADRIAGEWELSSLAHMLVITMENHLTESPRGELMAPSGFLIHMNPNSVKKWSAAEEWLSKLTLALQQVAIENNISFPSKPFIRIQSDPSKKPGKMSISVEKPPSLTDTAAIPVANLESTKPDSSSDFRQSYLLIGGKTYFSLDRPIINIGRQSDNSLVINDPKISRHHAQLRCLNGDVVISDLNSSGGTFVNSIRITQVLLNPGDVISLAGFLLIFGKTTDQNLVEIEHPRNEISGDKK